MMTTVQHVQRKCGCGGGEETATSKAAMPSAFAGSRFAANLTSTPVMLQRIGDTTRVPAGMSCPVATDSPAAVTNHLLFPLGSALLNAIQKSEIEALVRSWRSAGASAPVRIDGFASTDGTDELNWSLSCRRALAVQTEVLRPSSGRTPGVPSSFVRALAQGETTEFGPTLADNRRATIETTAGLTPPPVTCGTAPPCPIGTSGAPLLINPGIPSGSLCRGACGANCPDSCTREPDVTLCIPDSTGACHVECTYTGILNCGTHQGCRDHDACYDDCAARLGERDLCPSGSCHCDCDVACIRDHSFLDCAAWARGGGTFDGRLRFSNPPTAAGPAPGGCPP